MSLLTRKSIVYLSGARNIFWRAPEAAPVLSTRFFWGSATEKLNTPGFTDTIQKLSGACTRADQAITKATTDIEGLESRVKTAATTAKGLEGKVTQATNTMTTLGPKVTTATAEMATLNAKLPAITGSVSGLETRVKKIEEDANKILQRQIPVFSGILIVVAVIAFYVIEHLKAKIIKLKEEMEKTKDEFSKEHEKIGQESQKKREEIHDMQRVLAAVRENLNIEPAIAKLKEEEVKRIAEENKKKEERIQKVGSEIDAEITRLQEKCKRSWSSLPWSEYKQHVKKLKYLQEMKKDYQGQLSNKLSVSLFDFYNSVSPYDIEGGDFVKRVSLIIREQSVADTALEAVSPPPRLA